jgi:hypothetical protein
MKTFSIRTSDGGLHNIVADGFMVASDHTLEVVMFTQNEENEYTLSHAIALYAHGFWQSIREVQ